MSPLRPGFARLAIANIQRSYPYAPAHLLTGPQDLVPPRDRHPVFAGSYDWHSSVHMHWLLVRLLRTARAELGGETAAAAESLLDRRLTAAGIAREAGFLLDHPSFERPYGWAWLLALAAECAGTRWAEALAPGAAAVSELLLGWLPRAAYPVRHGTHGNSAFALGLVLDSARAAGRAELIGPVRERLLSWFREDHDAPVHWEPSGQDFLSPALTEADAMRRVLPEGEFGEWLRGFLPSLGPLLTPPRITDPSDPQIGHLIGLCLTRAASLRNYAPEAADAHLAAARGHLSGTDFTTAHWLATFALRAGLT